jgi:phosphoenolpyruvate synthase/pyruvate phosphate dikinase
VKKLIFNFKSKKIKTFKFPKNILGGKEKKIKNMGKLRLPVPTEFTITTEVCDLF